MNLHQSFSLCTLNRALNHFLVLQLSRHVSHFANYNSDRRVPNLPNLQVELLQSKPEAVSNSRLLQVAVIGVPNAGKSTLINQLVGWNICAVSKKVHTTRKMAKAMFCEGETQVVFLDTPGCVDHDETKSHRLESSFIIDPEQALMQSDLFIVLHDISNKWTQKSLSPKVMRLLHLYPEKQSILVLNKVDKVKEKRKLLDISQKLTCGIIDGQTIQTTKTPSKVIQPRSKKITLDELASTVSGEKRNLTENIVEDLKAETAMQRRKWTDKEIEMAIKDQVGWPHFSNLFMISALENDGTADVRDYLVESARPAKWLYNSAVVTDQSPYEMAIATLKSVLLETFPNEMPYKTQVSIEYWDIHPSGALNVVFQITCPTARTVPIFIGTGGRCVASLCQKTESELRNLFRCDLKIKIMVTSTKSRKS